MSEGRGGFSQLPGSFLHLQVLQIGSRSIINQLIKPENAKKSQHFHFLNPRKVFSALILGNWENPPLPSDIKPPLALPKTARFAQTHKSMSFI